MAKNARATTHANNGISSSLCSVLGGRRPPNENEISASSKKPRGRPLGSKNKPKTPPVTPREDIDTSPIPITIDIPDGHDIIETLVNLAKQRNASITVMCASGIVQEVTLRHPISGVVDYPMQGRFVMVSLVGTYVNQDCGRVGVSPELITKPPCYSFTIYLAGEYNMWRAFGGGVGGAVIASGVVTIFATLMKKNRFLRMGVVNGVTVEIEENSPRHASGVGVITNAADATQPTNTAINGSVGFGVANGGGNLAPPYHRQLPLFPNSIIHM